MLEKTLHTGNIAAAFGTLATTATDLTVLGGTATVIGGIFSGLAIFKKDPDARKMVEQMGSAFEAAVKASPLSDERKKLIPQIMQKYPVSEGDIAAGNLVAAQVANIIRARIDGADEADPALSNLALLDAYTWILTQTLEPVLAAPDGLDPMQAAVLKELLVRSDQSGEADKLRDEGITEKAIIRLAQRIAADTDDISQAWLALQNAMDIAARVQAEGTTLSNHGDIVDVVLAQVAELAKDGDYQKATEIIDGELAAFSSETAKGRQRLVDVQSELDLLTGSRSRRVSNLLIETSQVRTTQIGNVLTVVQNVGSNFSTRVGCTSLLDALRTHIKALLKEAERKQLPDEIRKRLLSYQVPLFSEAPLLISLEGPMSFLKGGAGRRLHDFRARRRLHFGLAPPCKNAYRVSKLLRNSIRQTRSAAGLV